MIVSRWAKLFLLAIFWVFLIPGLYMFGADRVFNGLVLKVVEYAAYGLFLPFLFYPFWKAMQWYKNGNKVLSIFAILIGIIMPIVSGVFGVFVFEILIDRGRNSISETNRSGT